MRTIVSIVTLLLLVGCSGADNGRSMQAPAKLTKWSWLPASDAHAAEVATLAPDVEVHYLIPENAPLKMHSDAPGGIDTFGNFIPREKKSIVVDGGLLVSQFGASKKTAQWGDWSEVWTDASHRQRAGWGYCLTSGEILLPRAALEKPPAGLFVQNTFVIESFGDRHVLITLDRAKGHRLCFLETDHSRVQTAGFLGSKAEVRGNALVRQSDGWYFGTKRMSN